MRIKDWSIRTITGFMVENSRLMESGLVLKQIVFSAHEK